MAHSDYLGWSDFRHADTVRILHDSDTFSNAVSRHRSVPNGMDPPQHTASRCIIDDYFTTELVDALEASCRDIARNLVQSLPKDRWVKAMTPRYGAGCHDAIGARPIGHATPDP